MLPFLLLAAASNTLKSPVSLSRYSGRRAKDDVHHHKFFCSKSEGGGEINRVYDLQLKSEASKR